MVELFFSSSKNHAKMHITEINGRYLLSILLLINLAAFIQANSLPDFITPCHRNDPDLNNCIQKVVDELKPRLKKGIKGLNVPAMEPLHIGDLNILEGGKSGITVRAKDLNIYGASNFEIKKLIASRNGTRYDFELNLPKLQGKGNYEISGQLLALPMRGNGPFTGNFYNFYAYVKIISELVKENDGHCLKISDLIVRIRTGQGNIHLQNLFNGDKSLGDIVNETINQNFELFTNELIGPIERALEKKFLTITRKIMENFSYEMLFPA